MQLANIGNTVMSHPAGAFFASADPPQDPAGHVFLGGVVDLVSSDWF